MLVGVIQVTGCCAVISGTARRMGNGSSDSAQPVQEWRPPPPPAQPPQGIASPEENHRRATEFLLNDPRLSSSRGNTASRVTYDDLSRLWHVYDTGMSDLRAIAQLCPPAGSTGKLQQINAMRFFGDLVLELKRKGQVHAGGQLAAVKCCAFQYRRFPPTFRRTLIHNGCLRSSRECLSVSSFSR